MKVDVRVNEISHSCGSHMTQRNLPHMVTRSSLEKAIVRHADSLGYRCLVSPDQRCREYVAANYCVPRAVGARGPARDARPVSFDLVPHLPGNTAGAVSVPQAV